MKNYLIYFLLFSMVGFSQNYQYSLEEGKIPSPVILPSGVNNQLEEIEYFKAYLLPVAQRANLQKALDTYGAVRLEKGDYSGVNVVMRSNQSLYGHPTASNMSTITIASGSSNVRLESVKAATVNFQAGGVISNSTFKSLQYCNLNATNAMIENNVFVNIIFSSINFNFSTSGYYRNNKFIKHQAHGTSNMLVLKGNSTTPSYGNVHLHTNLLNPAGNATDVDNLESITFVGLDGEAWNVNGEGTKPMLVLKNMGDVKITDFGGENAYSNIKTPTFDIDADNLFFFNKYIKNQANPFEAPTIAPKTNVLYFEGEHDNYVRTSGTVTGFDLRCHFNGIGLDRDVTLNGVVQNSIITSSTPIKNAILGTQHTPWKRPNWETLPDPLGTNWRAERVGKPDSTAYIQNLINTVGIAELPEGVFYISSTLSMLVNGTKGIIGRGTGKTVICGLTDDFPLITLAESKTGDNNFFLSNLTIQGGSVGLLAPDEMDLMAFIDLKYVVFRNQNYGIHLYWIFGLDNCFFDSVSFVECAVGLLQEAHPTYTIENAGYVDKVVFYNGQYLNCEVAFHMNASRANNLDAWVNCKFDGNNKALMVGSNNFAIAANCDFTNHKSQPVYGSNEIGNYEEDAILSSGLALYSCNFYNNHTSYISNSTKMYMEGCNLLDNITVFSDKQHYRQTHYILNSTIAGNVGGGWGTTSGVFVNSNFSKNPEFSKVLVNLKNNVPIVLINATPNPYPQLLVTD
jgi:hypothetical protein